MTTTATSSRTEEPAPEATDGADQGSPPPEEKKADRKKKRRKKKGDAEAVADAEGKGDKGEDKKDGDDEEDDEDGSDASGDSSYSSGSDSDSFDSESDSDSESDDEGNKRPKRSHQNPDICKGNSKGQNVGLVCYLTEPDDDEVNEEDRWRSCIYCGRQYRVRW